MQSLLWVEEAQEVLNLRQYDLKNTSMEFLDFFELDKETIQEDFFRIRIPGLSEGRPSVLRNDTVFAYKTGPAEDPETGDDGFEFEGWVLAVEKDSIVVAFNPRIKEKPNKAWFLRFAYNRYQKRIMHRAVQVFYQNPELMSLIRGSKKRELPLCLKPKIPFTQVPSEGLNKEQNQFILDCLNRTSESAPQLLFGPFGTGKTYTLAKLIRNLVDLPNVTVLVCANSNAATDALVDRLIDEGLSPNQLHRSYAIHRTGVSERLRKFSSWNQATGEFDILPLEKMKKFRVVVSTVDSAGALFGIGMRGAFTHIVIDEAAQINEAHGLVPLSLANSNTAIILAGDDKQIAPVVHSSRARSYHFDRSLLATLAMENPGQVGTTLVQNYRSHPEILAWPSSRFYGGKLQAVAAPYKVNNFLGWSLLGNKCPVLFAPVEGYDERDADSPSWYNSREAEKVVSLVAKLFEEFPKTEQSDVGVVAGTVKQVQKIRNLLRQNRLSGVSAHSTEFFQGTERQALFISLGRSSRRLADEDRHFGVGFVGGGKRLNTAFTRAIGLVVIVGDPFSMTADPDLESFLIWAKKRGAILPPDLLSPNLLTEEYLQKRANTDLTKLPEPLIGEMLSEVARVEGPRVEHDNVKQSNPSHFQSTQPAQPTPPPQTAQSSAPTRALKIGPDYVPKNREPDFDFAYSLQANPTRLTARGYAAQNPQAYIQPAQPGHQLYQAQPFQSFYQPPQPNQLVQPVQPVQSVQSVQSYASPPPGLAPASTTQSPNTQLFNTQSFNAGQLFTAGPNEALIQGPEEWGQWQELLSEPVILQRHVMYGSPTIDFNRERNEIVFSLVGLDVEYHYKKEVISFNFQQSSTALFPPLHSPDGRKRTRAELLLRHPKPRTIEIFQSKTALIVVLPAPRQ